MYATLLTFGVLSHVCAANVGLDYLLFLRHGDAEDGKDDRARALTDLGRVQLSSVGVQWLNLTGDRTTQDAIRRFGHAIGVVSTSARTEQSLDVLMRQHRDGAIPVPQHHGSPRNRASLNDGIRTYAVNELYTDADAEVASDVKPRVISSAFDRVCELAKMNRARAVLISGHGSGLTALIGSVLSTRHVAATLSLPIGALAVVRLSSSAPKGGPVGNATAAPGARGGTPSNTVQNASDDAAGKRVKSYAEFVDQTGGPRTARVRVPTSIHDAWRSSCGADRPYGQLVAVIAPEEGCAYTSLRDAKASSKANGEVQRVAERNGLRWERGGDSVRLSGDEVKQASTDGKGAKPVEQDGKGEKGACPEEARGVHFYASCPPLHG